MTVFNDNHPARISPSVDREKKWDIAKPQLKICDTVVKEEAMDIEERIK